MLKWRDIVQIKNGNIRTMRKISLQLTINTPKRAQ